MSTKEETKVELKNISKINEPNFEFLVKTDLPIVFCQNGLFFMSLAHEFGNIKYKKFHCLRHTFATKCVRVGMDVKSLSEILGHSNVSVTLGIYVHSSYVIKKKYIDKL